MYEGKLYSPELIKRNLMGMSGADIVAFLEVVNLIWSGPPDEKEDCVDAFLELMIPQIVGCKGYGEDKVD